MTRASAGAATFAPTAAMSPLRTTMVPRAISAGDGHDARVRDGVGVDGDVARGVELLRRLLRARAAERGDERERQRGEGEKKSPDLEFSHDLLGTFGAACGENIGRATGVSARRVISTRAGR